MRESSIVWVFDGLFTEAKRWYDAINKDYHNWCIIASVLSKWLQISISHSDVEFSIREDINVLAFHAWPLKIVKSSGATHTDLQH